MLKNVQVEKILFLDIETVPQTYAFEKLDEKSKELFEMKTRFMQKGEKTFQDLYNERGGIYAEFGKIVCISVGFVNETPTGKRIRMKSFYHEDEETLLIQFKRLLEEHYNSPMSILCGHNAKEFDFPYICRRMLINGVKTTSTFRYCRKKTLGSIVFRYNGAVWQEVGRTLNALLSLICLKYQHLNYVFLGADVARVYFEDKDLERIKVYCEKDVVALIQLFIKMTGGDLIEEAEISYS